MTGKGCGRHPTHGTTQPHIAPTSERDMSDGSRPEQSPKVFCSCNAASEAKGDGCSAIACRNGRSQQKRTWCKRRLVSQYVPTQRLSSNSSAHSRPHPLGIAAGYSRLMETDHWMRDQPKTPAQARRTARGSTSARQGGPSDGPRRAIAESTPPGDTTSSRPPQRTHPRCCCASHGMHGACGGRHLRGIAHIFLAAPQSPITRDAPPSRAGDASGKTPTTSA